MLFARVGAYCEGRGLYITRRRNETKLTAEVTKGADVNGATAVAINPPRTLERYDLNDEQPASEPVELVEGHKPEGPVVVDREHVYFLDYFGSSYWIARIDHTAAEPVLEHYEAGDAQSKPSFGVTGDVLWVSGLSRADIPNDQRLIVRDDDPSFKPVDDAVR
jgi:hypothetical protein